MVNTAESKHTARDTMLNCEHCREHTVKYIVHTIVLNGEHHREHTAMGVCTMLNGEHYRELKQL